MNPLLKNYSVLQLFSRVDELVHLSFAVKIVAALADPASIRHYLEGTGQSAEIPTLAPARSPPQAELDF
ncbi:MAG: hypothetical protein GY847_14875 [Proteobacteria bacterium]|nr:hypothetical protein [Pseudomonadota bacterium]